MFKLSSLLTLLLLIPLAARGADIVISEIAWMGNSTSSYDEWIELYNNTAEEISLSGWMLKSKEEKISVALEGAIPPRGFFLLERTNDDTVPEITADLIYKGGLSNKGEHLILFSPAGKVVDEVDCSAGWYSGDNATKKTMERKQLDQPPIPTNWKLSKDNEGTPKAENSFDENISPQFLPESREQESTFPFSSNGTAIAFSTAALSGAMALMLRKNQKSKLE